jgi:hypothetical protein
MRASFLSEPAVQFSHFILTMWTHPGIFSSNGNHRDSLANPELSVFVGPQIPVCGGNDTIGRG